jgi:hypothetical protein
MTGKNPFNDCTWFPRRSYQDSGHPKAYLSAAERGLVDNIGDTRGGLQTAKM